MQICSLSVNVNNNLFQTRTIKVVVFIRTQWLACEVRLMRNNSFHDLTIEIRCALMRPGKKNPFEIPMRPHAPCQKWLFLIGCSLETKFPGVLESSETRHANLKLSFETKLTIPRSSCDFSRIFQKTVLILDMASGRIDESRFSSDEEQEVFAGFTSKKLRKCDKLVKHG